MNIIKAVQNVTELIQSGKMEELGVPFSELLELLRNYIPASDLGDRVALERLYQQHEQISAALLRVIDAAAALPMGERPEDFDPEEVTDGLAAWLGDLSSLCMRAAPSISRKEALAETQEAGSPPRAAPPAASDPVGEPPAAGDGNSQVPAAGGEPVVREPDPRCTAAPEIRAVYGDGCLRKFRSCDGCPMLGPGPGGEER